MSKIRKQIVHLLVVVMIAGSLISCSTGATSTQTNEAATTAATKTQPAETATEVVEVTEAAVTTETAVATEASVATEATAATEATSSGEDKVVTVAMTSAWDSMMPLNTNSNYSVLIYDQIYDRLAQGNAEGGYDPRLADSWEVNDKSTEVTFHLNPNATWHDGEPLTADDVVFTFQMYSDPEVSALSRYYLSPIAGTDDSGAELSEDSIGVAKVDDYTVTITMKTVMYPDNLFNNLNGVFIIPKHIFEGKTAAEINEPDLWMTPIGSGPFKFESKIESERMEFTANENYFLGAPKIDRLVVRVVPTANLLAGLMSGEIDILAGAGLGSILLDDWETAQAQENLTTSSIPTTNYQMLVINTQKPYMTQNVRQAISMSINRDALVNSLLQKQGQAVITPISPINPYYNPDVAIWYDPEQAKTILEQENFPFDQELVFYVPGGNTTRERAAVLIQQDLQNVGIKVQIQSVDFPTLMNNMREGLHDFGIIGSGGTFDPSESRQMLAPDSSANFCKITSTEFADLADEGNAALTFETRKPIFDEYQVLVKDVTPMAYLYTSNSLMAYNKRMLVDNIENFSVLNWSTWTWDVE
ncbi:MAG: ABC transporter substrate-binding protein [Flexilinea sp.]